MTVGMYALEGTTTEVILAENYGKFRRHVKTQGGRIVKSSICTQDGQAAYSATVRWVAS